MVTILCIESNNMGCLGERQPILLLHLILTCEHQYRLLLGNFDRLNNYHHSQWFEYCLGVFRKESSIELKSIPICHTCDEITNNTCLPQSIRRKTV